MIYPDDDIDMERFFYDPNNIKIFPSCNPKKRWTSGIKITKEGEYIYNRDVLEIHKPLCIPMHKFNSPRIIDLHLGNGNAIQIVIFLRQLAYLGFMFIGVAGKGCGFFSLNFLTTPQKVKKELNLAKEDINNMVDWINTHSDRIDPYEEIGTYLDDFKEIDPYEEIGTYLDEYCIRPSEDK